MKQQSATYLPSPPSAYRIAALQRVGIIIMTVLLLALSSYMFLAAQVPGLVTQPLSDTLTAQDLANKLVGSGGGVTISNVVYTGNQAAAGTFSGGKDVIGFESGIILSTGHITSVIGPNTGTVADNKHETPGDPDLDSLAGQTTHDAAILTFDFVPNGDKVYFNFVFSSDEYNKYVGQINDVFAFYVNGTNCAVVASSGKPVSINSINKGTTGTDEGPNSSHPELYRDNPVAQDGTSPINTGMNGLTTILNCAAAVKPNETNTMKLAIADSEDTRLDSNVFIEAGSLSIIPPTPTPTSVPPTPAPTSIAKTETHTHGDVHIRTPDGLVYDFQEVGDFILTQSTDGSVKLQARQESWVNKPQVSINTAVALFVAGDKLEFYVKPERSFSINDELTDLPTGELALSQGGSIVINPTASASQQDFSIFWPDGNTGARVILYADSHIDIGIARLNGALTYEGVLGDLDGNRQNDMQIRNGDLIAPPANLEQLKSFGDSWRVAADESLFDDAAPIGEAVEPLTLRDLDPVDSEQAKQTCQNAGITGQLALDNCTYDVAVTDDPIFVESAQVFEEAMQTLSPCAKIPAQYRTLGAVFDANQTNAESITILDGDDLEIAIDESENGTRYLRFNVYRNAECVVSFSVGANSAEAGALAEFIAGSMIKEAPSTMSGQVVDLESRQPLAGVQVCMQNTTQCASTDANGNYTLNAVPPGEQMIEVSVTGYLTATQSITITPNALVMQPFALTADAELAATVKAEADRFPIMSGQTIVREQKIPSESGNHYLIFQSDGNVVVYTTADQYVWGLQNITDRYKDAKSVLRESDGNFVVRGANDELIWSALSENPDPSAYLTLTPEGVLQLVSKDSGQILWASQ